MMMMMNILWIKQHQVFSSSIFSLSTKLSWLFLSHNFRLLIKEKKIVIIIPDKYSTKFHQNLKV